MIKGKISAFGVRTKVFYFLSLLGGFMSTGIPGEELSQERERCNNIPSFTAKRLHSSQSVDFCKSFADKTLLVVNTASQCGFTPQFKDLESLYKRYSAQGLEVVGFPSKDFNQEFSEPEKTADICYKNYGVTFTMVSESSIKGPSANSFYQWLSQSTGKMPSWNFNKYLVSADGKVTYYDSSEEPLGGSIEKDIQSSLGENTKNHDKGV